MTEWSVHIGISIKKSQDKMNLIIVGLFTFIGVVYSSPFSENDYLMLRAQQIHHQSQAIRLAEERALKEMCFKTSGSYDAYHDLQTSQQEMLVCVKLTVNEVVLDYMRKQMSDNDFYYSRPERTIQVTDIVKGLCNKKSDLKQCQNILNVALDKCLDDKKKKEVAKHMENIRNMTDFICFNDANRVQKFIDNGGIQCFKRNVDGLVECAENAYTDISSFTSPTSMPNLERTDAENCKNLNKFFNCGIKKMKTCANQIPANIMKELVDHFLNVEECHKHINDIAVNVE